MSLGSRFRVGEQSKDRPRKQNVAGQKRDSRRGVDQGSFEENPHEAPDPTQRYPVKERPAADELACRQVLRFGAKPLLSP